MIWTCAASLSAQFEGAVVRPSSSPFPDTGVHVIEGRRVKVLNQPVRVMLRTAYQLEDAQIVGAPKWLRWERYDIEANAGQEDEAGPGKLAPLYRALLEERFHLKVHKERRNMRVLVLVPDKDGPRLSETAEGDYPSIEANAGRGLTRIVGRATSAASLAAFVGDRIGRVVVDKTGLRAKYDFVLQWKAQDPSDDKPGMEKALRERLGLRLEPEKVTVEVLVIDSIQRPSVN